MKPFFISIPHSGEDIPEDANWLSNLPEPILMCDVDRFVDRLYMPSLKKLGIPYVVTRWHRYVVDLNRLPEDIDVDSVIGSNNPSGKFSQGLHWIRTTKGDTLLSSPMTMEKHNQLVEMYFNPFHQEVRGVYKRLRSMGAEKVYHLDAHSMPSMGTKAHRDPGQTRSDIVVSDFEGKSCETRFKDLVIAAYESAGFKVAYNWPYIGGRVTQTYGLPDQNNHAIQVELNRALYMDETTKRINPEAANLVTEKIQLALTLIVKEL